MNAVRFVMLWLFVTIFLLCACGGEPEDPTVVNDGENNGEVAALTVELVSTPPSISGVDFANFEFICSGREVCQFECSLNDSDFASCSSPTTYTDLESGDHVFEVVAIDDAVRSEPARWEWTIDFDLPVVELVAGPDELTNEVSAEFDFTCSQTDCDFICQLEGEQSGVISAAEHCEPPLSYEDLTDDHYVFTVYGVSALGLEGPPAFWEWTVHTEPPTVEISAGPQDETFDDRVSFEFECVDGAICTFECALDEGGQSGDWQPCSSPHEVAGLLVGSYEFLVRATDELGNWAVASRSFSVVYRQWMKLAAAAGQTCGIMDDQRLWCWGHSSNGQLGVGPTDGGRIPFPMQVGDEDDWVDIAAGGQFACGIRENGTLWCWGSGTAGRLGIDDLLIHDTPQQVGDEQDWVSVTAQFQHACAIKEDSTLWCWGAGANGRLGLGSTANAHTPQQVGQDSDWRQVSAGSAYTCGVRHDDTLWCWGRNLNYSLGLGVQDTSDKDVPTRVGADTNWERVTTGNDHSCGLKTEGDLYCWGRNTNHQLGHISGAGNTVWGEPNRVNAPGADWADVAVGAVSTCGVRADGTLWCWGHGLDGRLAVDTTELNNLPFQVDASTHWSQVFYGSAHGCALRNDNSAWCWGANEGGELGMGADGFDKAFPSRIDAPSNQALIVEGYNHACSLGEDLSVHCWGQNHLGQLGQGDTRDRHFPVPVVSSENWIALHAGSSHNCMLKEDQSLWCWGFNEGHQLGVGYSGNRNEPVLVGDYTDWQYLGGGMSHTCGMRGGAQLWCWGGNSTGQLGLGDTTRRDVPTLVTENINWVVIDGGLYHTCGLQQDGTLWCWGRSASGILGLGDEVDDQLYPAQVGTNTDWVDLSVANSHACAIRENGTLWCWGNGQYGRLGMGNTAHHSVPTQVGTAGNWRQVSAGNQHTCAVRDDDTLWCWGRGLEGRLGNGQFTGNQTLPEQVGAGVFGATVAWHEVRAGSRNTYAIDTTGQGWAWGFRGNGRLGDHTLWRGMPTAVVSP